MIIVKEDALVFLCFVILYIFILVAIDIIGTVAERAERRNKDDNNTDD